MDVFTNAKGIEALAVMNNNFRKVLQTSKTGQVVLYALDSEHPTDGIIPLEKHEDASQFIYVVQGRLNIQFSKVEKDSVHISSATISKGSSVFIPEGVHHEVTAIGGIAKSFSVYTKPEFPDGLVQRHRI